MHRALTGALLAILLATGLDARAEEHKVREAAVPAAVKQAIARKYPQAQKMAYTQETDEGRPVYEVEFEADHSKVSVDVSPEGKILAEETTIPAATLPAPVKAGLASSKYKSWTIAKSERVVSNEKESDPSYELVMQEKDQRVEVVLDQRGTITKEEKKSARDLD